MRPVWIAVLGVAAVAAAAPPTATEAYRAGDLEAVRQAVARAPIGRAVGALRGDRATALAQLAGIATHPDGDLALAALADEAGSWDRRRAAAAAAAAAQITARLDGDRAIRDDLADDDLAAAATAWATIAGRADRWSDVRAHAVAVTARLVAIRAATADAAPDLVAALAPLTTDDDPEVRLAALEAIPAPTPTPFLAVAAPRVATDADPRVRAVAAAIVCTDGPDAGLAALGDDGRAALRELAAAPPDRPGALLGLARCLAADDDPAAARALTLLRQRAPRALRAPLAALARRP